MKQIAILLIIVSFFASCVPAKKLEDEKALNTRLSSENTSLKDKLNDANGQVTQLSSTISDITSELNGLSSDTADIGARLRRMTKENKETNDLYEQSVQQNKILLSKTSSEKRELLDSLTSKQNDLRRKERALDSLQ